MTGLREADLDWRLEHLAVPTRNPRSEVRSGDAEPTVERLWDALREVMDPEIPLSLVDLGLIYDIRVDGGTVEVDFTYTATACPCAHFIQWDIAERLQQESGVEDIRLNEVWNPPWTKARVTPEGRRRLKELGVSL
jgi:metal-sulfur cluster biosynthetic enzyme